MRFINAASYAAFVPPYVFDRGNAQTGNGGVVPPNVPGSQRPDRPVQPGTSPSNGNGGIVPPYINTHPGVPVAPNGNGGIVPPYILQRAASSMPKTPVGDCFPPVPVKQDGNGVDVIFVDVHLPAPKKPLVNLRGGTDCFPHLPTRREASGIDVVVVDVVLPGRLQAYAGRKLSN